MQKNVLKLSQSKTDISQELALMKMNIKAMRDRLNQDLDAMVDRVNRLLPAEDNSRQRRFRNFTKKDYKEYLEGKIV